MKRLLLVLALVAVAFSGCTEKSPSAEEIKVLMIDSVKNLDSYRFSTESSQHIEVFNRSINESNASTIAVNTMGEGAVNLTGRAMGLVQKVNLVSENKNASTVESETYIFNDTIYTMIGGNWTRLMLPNADLIWSRQNMVRNQAELLNHSQIELLGSENIDGQDTYKVKVTPDMNAYAAVLAEQVGSLLPVSALNLTEMYKNSSVEWTSWITKDTHLLKKNEINMNLTVTPETVGLSVESAGNFEMLIDVSATTLFKDFNQPVEIVLPEGARNATVLTIAPVPAVPQT